MKSLVDYKYVAGLLDSIIKIRENLTAIGDKLDTDYDASGEQKLVPFIEKIFSARDCLKEAEHYLSNL